MATLTPAQAQAERERQTRKRRIDPRLAAAGWAVVPYDATRPLTAYNRCAIEEYPTDNGPADYALCVDGYILGIVEAKKITLGPQNVLTQAERYSRGAATNPLNYNGFRVPFIYSTNGEMIWFDDVRTRQHRSHTIASSSRSGGFHTPAALLELLAKDLDLACRWFKDHPNDHSHDQRRLHPYQAEANTAIEDAIGERKRQMLVAMATGTGKTFMMVNEVYRLMKSGVAKRILFLVDRRALAAQAVRTFAAFEPEKGLKFDKIYEVYHQQFQKDDLEEAGEGSSFDTNVLPNAYLTDPKAQHAFVYVSTIQRMAVNLFGRDAVQGLEGDPIDEDAVKLPIPIHAFDLIIADECHRGYTRKELAIWRDTLEHFDATKIGLTATPAAHTTTYFKDIVYRYEYERAVREGYLVDYDVVTIKSDVRLNGVFVQQGEQVGMVDPTSGVEQLDLLEDEITFDIGDLERRVTSPDSNRRILEEVKKYADDHAERYGRYPKILIFAVNDTPHTGHADQLVDLARDVFGRGDSFVAKITGKVDRPLQRIREFRNRPEPDIAVTVDLLTTGIDIPDLEFIVFLRPVKSRILFEQMLGRGTRKGEQYPDKSHFVVFDCFDGTLLEFFRNVTGITAEPPEQESRTFAEVVEAIWNNQDVKYNTSCAVKRLQRVAKQMAAEARDDFARYIPDGDVGRFAAQLPRRLREDFTATIQILRDRGFQDLLETYARAPQPFYRAYETVDAVSSERLIRDGTGRELKPEDYLAAFARFVRENADHVDALRIVLGRPRDWSTQALKELLATLRAAPQRFAVEQLQRAHQLSYHKELVDLISMVKHAANEDHPLLTAEERVNLVFVSLLAGATYTPEQLQWLERIREHLIANLTIDEQDFDVMPLFADRGGWGRANRVFENRLPQLIHQLNEAIAI